MGHTIYYDKAFIRVGDQYIPLVNTGASNASELVGGRWVPEKDWSVLNWKHRGQVLFTESEIREIARVYEQFNQENAMSYKPRGKPFAPGEMERWIVGGMKRAHTIEEYCSFGNTINVVDYPNGMEARWRRQPFTTDEELHNLLKSFESGHDFDISFGNNREVIRTAPASSRENVEKPSVLEAIAGSRGGKNNHTAATSNPEPGKHKPHSPEL